MRATLVYGARAFAERPLAHPGDEAELAFDLNARTLSTRGAWIEIAVITSARGRLLASVDVRSLGGGDQVRLSASTSAGAVRHSAPQPLRRRPNPLTLTVDAARVQLVVDGAEGVRFARAESAPQPEAIALGPWRGGPRHSSGSVDYDRFILREAP
jgi:hypothetical protein